MTTLFFGNPVFKQGMNITCRRGAKWDTLPKDHVYVVDVHDPLKEDGSTKVLHVVEIETRVFKFSDLTDEDLVNEHDPSCRTYSGLLEEMEKVYDGFDPREMVTLCSFWIDS